MPQTAKTALSIVNTAAAVNVAVDSTALAAAHEIYHGDCLTVLKQLPQKSVNLVFADPPYRLQLRQELYRPNQTKVDGVADEWDKFASNEEYDAFTREWLGGCRRVMADNATIWVIGSYHNIFRVGKIMMDLGFWILNDVQWHKTNPMPNFRGVRFTNATETLIWAKKSERQKSYTFNHKAMKQLGGGKQMTSVWQLPLCTGRERLKNADGKKAHSTQKPEELLRRVILSSSSEGDVVLDPFLGSGTTSAVAKKLARRSIGIERERGYIALARRRLAAINPADYAHLKITEPPKAAAARVTMQQLLAARYLKKQQKLYSKDKRHAAVILADGSIKNPLGSGSIHQIGALLKQTPACNGWHFWHTQNGDGLVPLDEERKQYGENHG